MPDSKSAARSASSTVTKLLRFVNYTIMNTTTYRRPIPSPIQMKARPSQSSPQSASNASSNEEHPVRREVKKFCGSYTLEVAFEEDSQTLTTFEHVPGMVAVLCTLRKEGKVVGQGRGSSGASRMNRGIERTADTAINGALLSAANNP